MRSRLAAYKTARLMRIPARTSTPTPDAPMLEPWLQDEDGVGIDAENGNVGAMVLEVEDDA